MTLALVDMLLKADIQRIEDEDIYQFELALGKPVFT